MQLILISPPHALADEATLVGELLALGLARFHVRKPGWDRAAVEAYVRAIPTRYHARLVLHTHPSLAVEYALGGVHLPAASRAAQAQSLRRPGQTLSTSFHTLAEISQHRRRYDYVFLSPIFTSLSKEGYPAAFHLPDVARLLGQLQRRSGYVPQVVALGGIEGHRMETVRQMGFAGAAVLGAVWQSPDPVAAFRALQSVVG
jgi:thiamine-phosphate pyrophosphorylase